MRYTNGLSAAALLCLGTAEAFKFQMYGAFSDPLEAVLDVAKRATINTNFKYSAPQFSFYVDILVGSAHDFIRLRLGSDPFTWFPGPLPRNYCRTNNNDRYIKCLQSNFSGTFDPEGSTTFQNLTQIMNITGSDSSSFAVGYYGTDTIQIGQTEIDNVPIGIATDYTRIPQIGLGIGGAGSTQESLLRTMLNEDVISVLAYGLYLNDYDANSSELTVGAIDTAKYEGNLITFESIDTTTVQLQNLEYDVGTGEPEVLGSGWNANVEFSTGSIYLPDGPLETIVNDVDAYMDNNYGAYLLSCRYRYSDKVLRFNFDGMTINVPASQWIVPAYARGGSIVNLTDNRTPACTLLIDPIDNYGIAVENGYSAILGMPFVRATYMVHDFTNRQTSFAQAKLNTSDSEVKALDGDGVAPFASIVPSATDIPAPVPTETDLDDGSNGGDNGGSGGSSGSSTPTGAIAGGVVGGVAVIGIAIGAFFFLRKRQKKKQEGVEDAPVAPPPMQEHMAVSPGGQGPPGAPFGGSYNQPGPGGYTYSGQGPYNEQYGQAPVFPNKGVEPSPSHNVALSPRPVSEVAGSPMDQNQRYSSISPSGVSELPSPRSEHTPVELPAGH